MENKKAWYILFILIEIIIILVCLNFGISIGKNKNCEPSMICKKIKNGVSCNTINLN